MFDYKIKKPKLYPKDSGLVYIFAVLGILGFSLIVEIFFRFTRLYYVRYFATGLGMMVVAICYTSHKRMDFAKMAGFKNKLNISQVLVLLLIAISLFIASAPIAVLFTRLLRIMGVNNMPGIDRPFEYIFMIISVLILAPLSEEILFRNIVLRGLKLKGYLFSLIITSLLFMLLHMNPAQIVHQFIVGLILAYVMQISNNLLAPILVHFFNNAIAMLLTILTNIHAIVDLAKLNGLIYLVMIIFGFGLLISLLRLYKATEYKKRKDTNNLYIKYNFFAEYINAYVNAFKFIFNSKTRKQMIFNYNRQMYKLDYNNDDFDELKEEDDLLAKMQLQKKMSLGYLKLAIAIGCIGLFATTILAITKLSLGV